MATKKFLVDINLNGNKVTGVANGTEATDLVNKSQLDSVAAGVHWRPSVSNIQVDGILDPGGLPTLGDRYILTDVGIMNEHFGVIDGVGDNDIVEYNGSAFEITFDASSVGDGFAVINKATDDMYIYDGTAWELKSVDQVTGDGVSIDVISGVAGVKAGGIDTDRLADNAVTTSKISFGAVDENKLAANSVTAVKIAEDAVTANKINVDVAGAGLNKNATSGALELADGLVADVPAGNVDAIINHAFGTQYVIAQVFEVATNKYVECDIELTDANNITLTFNTAPTNGQYRVMIKALF